MKKNQEYAEMINALEPCKASVLNVEENQEGPALVIFDFDGGVAGTTAAIIFEDGTIFTLCDWQSGDYPQSFDEIADFDWRVGVSEDKAIVLCGLPRMLF